MVCPLGQHKTSYLDSELAGLSCLTSYHRGNPPAVEPNPAPIAMDCGLLSVCKENLLPIALTIFGGILVGGLFLFFAVIAALVGATPHMAAFAVVGFMLLFGPVSLVIAYLWWEKR